MKKSTHFTLALFCLIGSHVALANINAPNIRGEYPAMALPDGINLSHTTLPNLPSPVVQIGEIAYLPTILIPSNQQSTAVLDVTLIDDFIDDVSPNARHYPPNFPNRTSLHNTRETVKVLSDWLEPYATATDASFDVLLRAVKINIIARNLDLGPDYGLRATNHINNALKQQPNHTETNFLYGMMLSESGAFREGKKYLDKAAAAGYLEAEQSLAQSELLSDNKTAALTRLQKLLTQHPDHPQIAEQINIINSGGFYIWDIKDDNLNVKPLQRSNP